MPEMHDSMTKKSKKKLTVINDRAFMAQVPKIFARKTSGAVKSWRTRLERHHHWMISGVLRVVTVRRVPVARVCSQQGEMPIQFLGDVQQSGGKQSVLT